MGTASVETTPDGSLELVLHGEIDFTNSAAIVRLIRTAVDDGRPTAITVDLSRVTFLDSSGIGVLVHAMRAADEAGVGYQVRNPIPPVHDQLKAAGLLAAFGLGERV